MKTFALLAIFLALGSLSGCSSFSAQARQERAYTRYVQKMSRGRAVQQRKLNTARAKVPPAAVSEPIVDRGESGPQSVTSGDGASSL